MGTACPGLRRCSKRTSGAATIRSSMSTPMRATSAVAFARWGAASTSGGSLRT